ncbi:MAG: tRNA epoxyqueuosine(34) reductase QueG [Gammaproteobacteria bacterium]|nr:tRNA epoxyqueuosine(34) reductase QueG [Gammaproteobacteria bacterium]
MALPPENPQSSIAAPAPDAGELSARIKTWGRELGFQQLAVSGIALGEHEAYLERWLALGRHGEMDYMARHGTKRSRPAELEPGTLRVITARMDYLPPEAGFAKVLSDPAKGYISRYALGRDYHKLLRKRLQQLAERIAAAAPCQYRVYVDSAPVLEKALAAQSGLGWIGKHTVLIHREAGSWFFLGEIYTDLPLVPDEPVAEGCGACNACQKICPTGAIVAPYELDARLCISYLTIELRGAIPVELRPLIGNRIYGCDDCQLICPWNRYAKPTDEGDFRPRDDFRGPELIALFAWDEDEFLKKTEGSPIRRIGHQAWLRNIAVALGNGPATAEARAALLARAEHPSELVRKHVAWALARQAEDRGTRVEPRLLRGIERMLPRDA